MHTRTFIFGCFVSLLGSAVALGAGAETTSGQTHDSNRKHLLRVFQTIYVDASKAHLFGNDQLIAELQTNKDFQALSITIVDNPSIADVELKVGYTFAWDYPFTLRHPATSEVLLAGKGSGAFSGPAGAKSVATELTKLLKPYRLVPSVRAQ